MKKRIGTIYNKPIIEGDINLKTPNEIHKSELKGGGDNTSGGSVSKYAPRYFKIDWDKASKDWEYVLSLHSSFENLAVIISSSNKLNINNSICITNYPMTMEYAKNIIAFSYLPVGADFSSLGAPLTGITDFNNLIGLLPNLLKDFFGLDLNFTMEGITEITEEEYYKID